MRSPSKLACAPEESIDDVQISLLEDIQPREGRELQGWLWGRVSEPVWALEMAPMTAPPWAGQKGREMKGAAQISFQRSWGSRWLRARMGGMEQQGGGGGT